MALKNLFGRGIGFGGPQWVPTHGYATGVVPPTPTQVPGGGWVREDELEKFAKQFNTKGKIRAVASPGVSFMDATVTAPFRARELPKFDLSAPVVVPVVPAPPPTPVVGEMVCMANAGLCEMLASAGVGADEYDRVLKRFQAAEQQAGELRMFGFLGED